MRTKRVSLLVLIALIAGGTLALSARGVASEAVAQGQEPQPGNNQIIVVLTCTTQQGGGIRVNPFRRHLASDATATWRRVGNYRGSYTIEPVGFFPWTLSNGGVSDASGQVSGTPREGGAPDGVYSYVVKFECDGDEVVLDPRMEVP